jgi:hypothetical protein
MSPLVAGNKLVIPVTLVICDIAHTDVGEAFLTSLSRKGEPREEENAATEAYSQAFRRACAQFGLGRYLYDLPKAWVPYDPQKRAIALSEEDLRRLAEQLYHKAGLLPTTSSNRVHAVADASSLQAQPGSARQVAGSSPDTTRSQEPVPVSPRHMDDAGSPTTKPASLSAPSVDESHGNLREAGDRINPDQRSWVERQLGEDQTRITRVCQFYHVNTLDDLSGLQTVDLVNRLFAEQAKARKNQAREQTEQDSRQNRRKAVVR